MHESVSKWVLGAELLLVLTPVTYVVALWCLLVGSVYRVNHMAEAPWQIHAEVAFSLFGAGLLLLGWSVCVLFLLKGRSWLGKLGRYGWLPLRLGAALLAAGALSLAWTYATGAPMSEFMSTFNLYGVCSPALVPFAHMEIERHFARKATRTA